MSKKGKVYPVLVGVFVLAVFVYGSIRIRNPLRWSAWGSGDAQALLASDQFARYGFKMHYFCNYQHAGYLGKSYGGESSVGYYTRYPCGQFLWYGWMMRFFDRKGEYVAAPPFEWWETAIAWFLGIGGLAAVMLGFFILLLATVYAESKT